MAQRQSGPSVIVPLAAQKTKPPIPAQPDFDIALFGKVNMRKKALLICVLAAGLSFLTSYSFADWGPAKRLTWTADESWNPVLAIDSGGVIHVVWSDYTPGNSEIFYKSSTDGGASWNPNKRLSWTPANSEDTAVAIDSSGTLHVVWSDVTPGQMEIYYKKSEDTGATWSPTQRITWTSGTSLEPAIAIDSSSVIHVVWYDDTPVWVKVTSTIRAARTRALRGVRLEG